MIQKDTVRFRGVAFEYGDEYLVVPPLPLGVAKELQKEFAGIVAKKTSDEDQSDAIVALYTKAAELALKRNYEEVTSDTVADFLTPENMIGVFRAAVYGIDDAQDKVKTVGEAKAVLDRKRNQATATPSTGDTSTVA